MRLSDFDFDLPPELIAQHPAAERGASRLLHVAAGGEIVDRMFRDLPSLLSPGDLLVFNDTRVVKARLRGRKDTGGEVEALVERVLADGCALAHVRASKTPFRDVHFHDSRSEAISRLAKKLDVLELARVVGHRDPRSLMAYYRASASELAKKLG